MFSVVHLIIVFTIVLVGCCCRDGSLNILNLSSEQESFSGKKDIPLSLHVMKLLKKLVNKTNDTHSHH